MATDHNFKVKNGLSVGNTETIDSNRQIYAKTGTQVGEDGTYGGYGVLGFGGITNGYNRIFGRDDSNDGLFIAAATGRKVFIRSNGAGTDDLALGFDDSYSSYKAIGFGSSSANGKNKIFAHPSTSDGIFICSATGRNIYFRVNGGASNNFEMTAGGVFNVAGTGVLDQSRNLFNIGTISSGAITSSSTVQGTAYLVGSTVIVNTNRDLTNIGTISSGAITTSGDLTLSGAGKRLYISGGSSPGWSAPVIWREGTQIAISDYSGVALGGYDGTAYGARLTVSGPGDVNVVQGALKIGDTTVIDSSRNLTNIGTISSSYLNTTSGGVVSISTDGSSYASGMSRGALEIGSTARNYRYTSGWSGSMQSGILANTSEDWEFMVHDAGDALGSIFVYESANNAAGLIRFGRNVGYGTADAVFDGNITGQSITGQSVLVNNGLTVRNGNTNAAISVASADNFCGIGWNRNVSTGAIYDSDINAFQMHIQNNVLEIETYNGSGSNVTDNAWTLDTSGNMGVSGSLAIGGNTVIDSSRNLTNIGTYSGAGDVVAQAANVLFHARSSADGQTVGYRAGYLNHTSLQAFFRYTTGDAQLYIDNDFTGNNGVYSNINFRNKANGGSSLINRMTIHGSTGNVNITGGALQMGGTTVINSARSINNVTLGALATGARFEANNWHQDSSGQQRFYFEGSGRTFYKTGSNHIFRNSSDSGVASISSDGSMRLATSSDLTSIAYGLQVRDHTFTGGNGVYANSRIGVMLNGALTSYVYASTYNDATYPDYGFVFIHGPSTSSYNVWSISPDGPAKGDSLNFIYGNGATNIHTIAPKVVFDGNGDVDIRSGALKSAGTTVIDASRNLTNINLTKFRTNAASFYISPTNPNTLNAQYDVTADTADMWINYRGYADGFSYFRDFRIGDGKGTELFFVDGSDRTFRFGGSAVTSPKVAIGNVTPSKNLHIYTADNEGIFLQGTGSGVWMDVQSNGAELWSMGCDSSGWAIYNRTDAAYYLRVENGGDVNIVSGGLKVGGTTVIDSSRNLTNIGAITAAGINNSSAELIDLNDATYLMLRDPQGSTGIYIGGTGDSNTYYDTNTHIFRSKNGSLTRAFINGSGVDAKSGGFLINGTTVIDSSRNLTNINAGAFGEDVSAMDTANLDIESVGNVSIRGGSALYFGITSNSFNTWKTRIYSANTSTMQINAQALNFNDAGYGSSTFFHSNSTGFDIRTGSLLLNQTTVIDSSRNLRNVTAHATDAEYGQSMVGNFGQWLAHSYYASSGFNADVAYWGWNFVQTNTNAPHTNSSQWYRNRVSLGDAYGHGVSTGDYWLEMAYPRYNQAGGGLLYIRSFESGSYGSWYEVGSIIRGNITLGSGNSTGVLKLKTYDDAANEYHVYNYNDDTFRINYNGSGGDEMIMDSSGNVTFSGNVTAYSDERLKSDIQTLDGSKVLKMRGVSFIKDGEAGSGVIAQELEKVAPELVSEIGEYKSVAYGNLTGYLIEAIKEQQQKIEKLEELVERLISEK